MMGCNPTSVPATERQAGPREPRTPHSSNGDVQPAAAKKFIPRSLWKGKNDSSDSSGWGLPRTHLSLYPSLVQGVQFDSVLGTLGALHSLHQSKPISTCRIMGVCISFSSEITFLLLKNWVFEEDRLTSVDALPARLLPCLTVFSGANTSVPETLPGSSVRAF